MQRLGWERSGPFPESIGAARTTRALAETTPPSGPDAIDAPSALPGRFLGACFPEILLWIGL